MSNTITHAQDAEEQQKNRQKRKIQAKRRHIVRQQAETFRRNPYGDYISFFREYTDTQRSE